jgi:hypothetical protein
MKTLLLLALCTTTAFAHENHDWRQDYEAYLRVNYEIPFRVHHIEKSLPEPFTSSLDMDFFKENLAKLSGEKAFMVEGVEVMIKERKSTTGLDHARALLKEEYEKLGFVVSFQPFGRGVNFIAEKLGKTTPEKVLVLSSHIDSVGNKGANDNGTGTIGLLTVSKLLAKKDYSSTIRILGFDREEDGLIGSDAYVATIPDSETIIGNINFEMMGVNSRGDGAFHVIDCDKKNSLFLSDAIKSSISTLNLPLSVVKTCTDRSDHASFWRKKLPAVVISENFFGGDADPCYHAKCDVMDDRLNYDYMKNILDAVLAATENIVR